GTTYIIEFNAISASHTIKFTNWGHICFNCSELVLDNVRLYTLTDLSSSVPSCGGSSSSPNFFAASDTDICEKFCVNFFDSSFNNPIAWQWIFPGGSPATSAAQNPSSICYSTPGIYDVTLITTSANGDDTLTLTNYITVNPTPATPIISQVGYTLTSTFASTYQWQLNSVDIPGATSQAYTVLQSGLYTVVVSDSNGCTNIASKDVVISGIDEVNDDANIFISPNPSNGNFTIQLLKCFGDEISIEVVNALGQNIFSSAEKITGDKFKKEIDLRSMARGAYFIEVKTINGFARKKIFLAE
ncbi:MAG: T9SS type A sorting domain-containing protein, partial [Chitinophagales bacterium]